jgi:hypothetical protein
MSDDKTEKPELAMTSEEIYERFKLYQELGLLQYVLPTDPLGEQWILGAAPYGMPLTKLIGDGDAIVYIAATEAMIKFMAERMGVKL